TRKPAPSSVSVFLHFHSPRSRDCLEYRCYERPPNMYSSADPRNKPGFDGKIPHMPKLLDRVREVIRMKHYSIRTKQAYVDWINPVRENQRIIPKGVQSLTGSSATSSFITSAFGGNGRG